MGRRMRVCAAVVLVGALALAGCAAPEKPAAMKPRVAPPAVGKAGVLRVGVDLAYPPFGGSDNGKKAGIDVDVASALAAKLGLAVELVDMKPSDVATALASGKVDVVMSVPLTAESLSDAGMAGTYISDGPALFTAQKPESGVSLTLESLTADSKVGVQKGSPSYWELLRVLGTEDSMKTYDTLRGALESLQSGEVKIVAGDAIVGSYIARDLPGVSFAGKAAPATPLGVAVKPDNQALSDPVRNAMDRLAADGVLDTIRRKWVGDVPLSPASDGTDSSAAGQ